MKVRMLRTHRTYEGGKEYILTDEEARMWIENGLASEVKEAPARTVEHAAPYEGKPTEDVKKKSVDAESGSRRDK